MRVLEYGKEHEKTLLFLPCTAEPEWVFADSVGLLSQDYHVMQIVYDGHGETGEDFILLYFRTGISPHKTPSKPVSTPLEGAMI